MRSPLFALLLCPIAAALGQPANDLEAVVTTDLGTFRFAFAPEKAPKHVERFLTLARQGFYDGSAFHRVVSYGIIQGGDPLLKDARTPRKLWGSGGLNQLAGEFSDLKHERGAVSTVSIPGKADSDGAQFFVCMAPPRPLDGKFTALRHGQHAPRRRRASGRPLGTHAEGRFPRRCEARARHRQHGARRRSGFGQYVVLPDARIGAAPGRKILRVRSDCGRDGRARGVRKGRLGRGKSPAPPGNRRGGRSEERRVGKECRSR